MTFQSQLDAGAGGSVLIDPGTYTESVSVPANTYVRMPNVVLNASGLSDGIHGSAGGVTIDGKGSAATPDNERGQIKNANGALISIANQHVLTFLDLILENWYVGGSVVNQSAAAISLSRSGQYTIERCRIIGNATQRQYGNGIWVKRDTSATLGPCRIANNWITDGYDGIGGETENDDDGGFPPETVIEWNRVEDCHDDGIQSEGRGENVYLLHNYIKGCAIGIALAAVRIGTTYVRWNRVYDGIAGTNNAVGVKLGETGTGLIVFEHNLIDHRNSAIFDDSIGFQQTNAIMQPIVAKHNRLYVGRYAWDLNFDPLPVGSDVDFNRYYVHVGSSGQRFKWDGTAVADLAAWRTASGHDANSIYTSDMALVR